MTATVHDLLSRRTRRQQPALHFATDREALTFTAERLDALLNAASQDQSLLMDTQALILELRQAADIVRACMRVAPGRQEDSR